MNNETLSAAFARLLVLASIVNVPSFTDFVQDFIKTPKANHISKGVVIAREARKVSAAPNARSCCDLALDICQRIQLFLSNKSHNTTINASAKRSCGTYKAKRTNGGVAPTPEMQGKAYWANNAVSVAERDLRIAIRRPELYREG